MPAANVVQHDLHDSGAWGRVRRDVIKTSKAAGHKHLDQVCASVEALRGKAIYYVHDPKVRGIVRTVGNHGDVFVHWSDRYSADKEMATQAMEGGVVVWRSALAPSDLKDYVLAEGVNGGHA